MGNNTQVIHYPCGSIYEGGVNSDKLPQNLGKLTLHLSSPFFCKQLKLNENKSAQIEGFFEKGKLEKVKFNTQEDFKFQGTLNQNGQFQPQGKLIDSNSAVYQGIFQNGKLMKGKVTDLQGQKQNFISYECYTEGQYIGTSIINGKGNYFNHTDKFYTEGEFHKGKLTSGTYIYPNIDKYTGQFNQGYPNGKGMYKTHKNVLKQLNQNKQSSLEKPIETLIQKNKLSKNQVQIKKQTQENQFIYEGEFLNGLPSGKGEVLFDNGDKYVGKFKQGKMYGKGQYTFVDGTIYKGNFYYGCMTGECQMEFTQNSQINIGKEPHQVIEKYEGEVNEGIFHGLGILYFSNGVIFKGYFLQGAKNGPGVLIFCQKKFKCLYMMNKLLGQLQPIIQ